MPLTIDEQIAAEAYSRLLNVPDGFAEVIRVSRRNNDWIPKDNQLLLFKSPPSRLQAFDCPGNPPLIGWQVTLTVYCHTLQDVNDTEPTDKGQGELAANVIKAMTGVDDWYRFGAGINTQIETIRRTTKDSFDVYAVPFVVQYRAKENDPYAN
jgi:hypothetical protein